MVKFEAGSWPEPRLWKGPLRFRVIGFLTVLEPDGGTVRPRPSTPLEILCEPLKVCLSSVWASAEPELLLLPQAARTAAISTTDSADHSLRQFPVRPCMRFLLARHGQSRECSIALVRRNLVVLLALVLWPSSAAAAP